MDIVYVPIGAWKHWDANLAEATWLVNTREYDNHPSPAETKLLHSINRDKVPGSACREVAGEGTVGCLYLGKKQTHFWDCLLPKTCVHLVGDVKEWGYLVCASRRFNVGRN